MAAHRPAVPPCTHLLAIAMVLALAAPPALAGLGDMVKSAKNKVTKGEQKPAAATGGSVPVFDDRTLELTEQRVGQLLAGFKAAAPMIEERKKVIARQDALNQEISDLNDKHGQAIGENMSKRDQVAQCITETIQERQRAATEEKIRNPQPYMEEHKKIAELTVKFSDAQAKGDTATVRKVQEEMARITAPTPQDSAAARAKCGTPPPPLPAGVRLEAANKELGASYEQARALDLKAMEAQSKASGLTEDQTAIAIHRIVFYLRSVDKNPNPSGFTPAEYAALAAHKKELAAAIPI